MIEYTPGPWNVIKGYDCLFVEPKGIRPSPYNVICRVSEHTFDYSKAKTNAHLIAAAPELLEALEGLLADITEYQSINNLGGENNHWQVAARAVIAKARGELP